uniref:C-type lectin domain-containing protein n=1 Tax=Maylandia zebra TaxID=106582 RepID=A0A3P9CAJ4_9CICH
MSGRVSGATSLGTSQALQGLEAYLPLPPLPLPVADPLRCRCEKTWEEALEYCREHHNDLASVASETETMLIQRELRKHNTTNNVWIGLRFLSRDWLWVDGQEMDYEAWSEEGKPLCPHPKMKCGALQVRGGSLSVWEAHDCAERHNFICY